MLQNELKLFRKFTRNSLLNDREKLLNNNNGRFEFKTLQSCMVLARF